MEKSEIYVLKFGGSSLASYSHVKRVARFVSEFKRNKNCSLIIVVSAMGKTTSVLINLANNISPNHKLKHYAPLICEGENISTNALALALDDMGEKCKVLSSKDVKIYARGDNENAVLTHIDTRQIYNQLEAGNIVIIPGFQAVNDEGDTICLGRGGSDLTATALGATLNAKVIIYTDTDGYFSADPNEVKNTKKIKQIGIKNAIELSSGGAKIMQQNAMEVADKYKVDLKVARSLTNDGTKIIYDEIMSHSVTSITFKNNLYITTIRRKKNAKTSINSLKKPMDCIFYEEFCINNEYFLRQISADIPEDLKLHKKTSANKQIDNCELVSMVGSGFLSDERFKTKLQNILKNNRIFTFLINISATKALIAVKPNKALGLLKILHKEFI